MIVLRLLGRLLILAGLILLIRDLLDWLDAGRLAPISLEDLWSELSGRIIEGNALHPFLGLWATAVFLSAGAALALLGRDRAMARRRRRRR